MCVCVCVGGGGGLVTTLVIFVLLKMSVYKFSMDEVCYRF